MSILNVEVEDKLLDDFRKLAVNKRGKIYGVLMPEVELALRNHLANDRIRHTLGGETV